MVGMVVLSWVGNWYISHRRQNASKPAVSRTLPLPQNRVVWALLILVLLTATKNVYMASVSSYFTFYVIDKFELSVQQAQLMLFLFLGSVAVGTFLGGPIGDRFGARFVIWFSILGVIPFALLLPYANLFWTGVLSVVIGLIFASAFSAIVVFAQELVPGRVGLIAGVFFGFAFGAGGLVQPCSAVSPTPMASISSTASAPTCRCSVSSRSSCRVFPSRNQSEATSPSIEPECHRHSGPVHHAVSHVAFAHRPERIFLLLWGRGITIPLIHYFYR